jgi:hypothetical protein
MKPRGCAEDRQADRPPRSEALGRLCRIWKVFSGAKGRVGGPCVYVPERVANRPDPCIYSQFLLMNLGQPVTWDNPDVVLRGGGVEQYTYDLSTATNYDVEVTVHNASRRKAALGTEVRLGWIEFGAGGEVRHAIGSTYVDVPVWPATATAAFVWKTPTTPGHYCLDVDLEHPDDGNRSNNRGWNNTQVHQAHSEVSAPIRIFNRWPKGCPPIPEDGTAVIETPLVVGFVILGTALGAAAAAFDSAVASVGHHAHIEVAKVGYWAIAGALGGFVVGLARNLIASWWRHRRDDDAVRKEQHDRRQRERLPCDLVEIAVDSYRFQDGKGKEIDPAVMFAPEPSAWPARVEPTSFRFDEGELHRDVLLTVDSPEGPGPPAPFNISVRQGGEPTGGVTIVVERAV